MKTITVVPAPYRLVQTESQSEGKCITCGWDASRIRRYYKNLETNEEHSVSVRTRCLCPEYKDEADPYKPYARPDHFVSGVWHEWKWNASTQKWEGTPEA